LKVTYQSWSILRSDPKLHEGDTARNIDEGFLCITAPQSPEPEPNHATPRPFLQPVYLLTTVDDSPIALAGNSEDLLKPLISKVMCVVEENCAVANRQLSESVCLHSLVCLVTTDTSFSVLKFSQMVVVIPGYLFGSSTTLKF
jgi:hypothetical protein